MRRTGPRATNDELNGDHRCDQLPHDDAGDDIYNLYNL
jgi:hypothetical protein